MLPTLQPGQEVLVSPISQATPLAPGELVVCRHPLKPQMRIIKRVTETFYDGSCYLLSDNLEEGSDSRSFGVVGREHIIGRVTSFFF